MNISKQAVLEIIKGLNLYYKDEEENLINAINSLPVIGGGWISVDTEPCIEKYYKLAFNDDVYLDVFRYRGKGIDGNAIAYFRSVNDNSTLDLSEVSHYEEFKTDAPDWTNLLPSPPTKSK